MASGTFVGTVQAAAVVAAESFTAATAQFDGNVWVDGNLRLTEGGAVSFYAISGGSFVRHGSVAGSSGALVIEGDDEVTIRTLDGDINLNPGPFGEVDVNGTLNANTLQIGGTTVQIGPAGSGPGGSGRALYLP